MTRFVSSGLASMTESEALTVLRTIRAIHGGRLRELWDADPWVPAYNPARRRIGYMLDTPLGIAWPDDGVWYWSPRDGIARGWPATVNLGASEVYIGRVINQ